MVNYSIVYAKQAQKDAKKISQSNLKEKALELIDLLQEDPFRNPPEYEAVVGDLSGAYSRRINIQHRLVYQVYEEEINPHPLAATAAQKQIPISNLSFSITTIRTLVFIPL